MDYQQYYPPGAEDLQATWSGASVPQGAPVNQHGSGVFSSYIDNTVPPADFRTASLNGFDGSHYSVDHMAAHSYQGHPAFHDGYLTPSVAYPEMSATQFSNMYRAPEPSNGHQVDHHEHWQHDAEYQRHSGEFSYQENGASFLESAEEDGGRQGGSYHDDFTSDDDVHADENGGYLGSYEDCTDSEEEEELEDMNGPHHEDDVVMSTGEGTLNDHAFHAGHGGGLRFVYESPRSYDSDSDDDDDDSSIASFPSIRAVLNQRSNRPSTNMVETRTPTRAIHSPDVHIGERRGFTQSSMPVSPPGSGFQQNNPGQSHRMRLQPPPRANPQGYGRIRPTNDGTSRSLESAPIKEGLKRFGSPLSTASKTDRDERDKHLSKKLKSTVPRIHAPRPAAGPSVVVSGPSPAVASSSNQPAQISGALADSPSPRENPYGQPASRGEVRDIYRILDGLTVAVRDLGNIITHTSRDHNRNQQSTSYSGGSGVSQPPAAHAPLPQHFEPKRKGGPVHRSDEALLLSDEVQQFARTMLKRKSADSPFIPSTLATPRQVKLWEVSESGEFCCTKDDFRIDINTGASNAWNASAAIVFAEAFVASGEYESEDKELIASAFLTHLRTLRKKYRERDLTIADVANKLRQARRDQRKEKLFHRRRKTALKYPELSMHIPMLETLGVDGMSSDESTNEDGEIRYSILRKSWRAVEITSWLQGFDAVEAITRGKRGRRPHKRMVSTKIDDSRPPVKGLPKNAYNATWYATIGPLPRASLHRSEEEYRFGHCEAVRLAIDGYKTRINHPAQYR